jgi:hypothetical protein
MKKSLSSDREPGVVIGGQRFRPNVVERLAELRAR